jgi:general nucleoside transport system permease protein
VSALAAIVSCTLLAQTLRMAVPYACAALGGVWSERSGVVNIGLEGMLLASGLGGIAAHHATGSAWAGVAAGAATGAAFGAGHALLCVRGRVDAIVSGLAVNLVAAGGTRFVLRALYQSSSNSPAVEGFRVAGLTGSSGLGLLARTLVDPLTLLAVASAAATYAVLAATRFGLRVRACGEDPVAAASVGVPVARVRVAAVTLGGAVCGLGGVALAFDQHQFQSGMSGGRGFIALAAVILAGWRPLAAVATCFGFAALDALEIVLQDEARIPQYAVQMLPYVATLVALVVIARSSGVLGRGLGLARRAPAGLGKHPD